MLGRQSSNHNEPWPFGELFCGLLNDLVEFRTHGVLHAVECRRLVAGFVESVFVHFHRREGVVQVGGLRWVDAQNGLAAGSSHVAYLRFGATT